ncbi:hypothetical protein [Calothrix sp. NIES-2098]|uniref:hypothetical protein n=1 Tax=Calothrix sp. NIES-2098 TaxID=1954171 RepID=UPI000B5FE533|nr:hypothetical protein NIES2098_38100 [Calothrix sp. NIES-2098]
MTLPEGFDAFEHLQQTYRAEFNRRVDRYFSDVEGTGDLSSVRSSLKLACRITDDDNDAIMNMRRSLFFDVIGYGRKNLSITYGTPFGTAPPVAAYPQLFLVFMQDASAQAPQDDLVIHEKSCRLMKYACASGESRPAITKANMTEIATEIKELFLENHKGITYTSGNKSASYTDPSNGFPRGNYMLVNSKTDAVNIFEKMCNAIDVPFKGASHIVLNDPDKESTTTATAGTTTILGKSVKNRRYRPVAVMRFRYAYISLGNLTDPIFLIDTTFRNQSLVKWY